MKLEILVIDDNEQFCLSLLRMLNDETMRVRAVNDSRSALSLLGESDVDVILLDIRLGDESGLAVLPELKKTHPRIPVIMLTGFGTIESAVDSIKAGASDYIQKPVQYHLLIDKIRGVQSIGLSGSQAGHTPSHHHPGGDILSRDRRINALKSAVIKLASGNLPILLYGENGTGKEMFADFAYCKGSRTDSPFIKVNCASFPDSLLDNELFGHEKGAYTGAHSVYKGVFERADKGTLFLDEIGDMSLEVQAKVLRILQNKELYRLGGKDVIKVDVQLISATNKKLENLIQKGLFRKDLFYRLNAAIVSIPPLNQRMIDIPLLADHFLKEYAAENHREICSLSDEVLDILLAYEWPGNIRELKNVISYSAAMATGSLIREEDLPLVLLRGENERGPIDTPLEQSERDTILRELMKRNFNKKKVAASLNISRTTLYNKLKKYNITGFPDG